jgi:hypothetical protein
MSDTADCRYPGPQKTNGRLTWLLYPARRWAVELHGRVKVETNELGPESFYLFLGPVRIPEFN